MTLLCTYVTFATENVVLDGDQTPDIESLVGLWTDCDHPPGGLVSGDEGHGSEFLGQRSPVVDVGVETQCPACGRIIRCKCTVELSK